MLQLSNAKINIGLQIVGRRSDGYHLINTILYPVRQLADVIEVLPSKYTDLLQTGLPLGLPAKDNLAIKAYRLLAKDFDLPPIMIYLHKLVPAGAGLGGGSSNATSVLLMLNKLFDLGLDQAQLKAYASRLGADCAFFVYNKPSLATGIGDVLEPIDLDLEQYHIVIVKPHFSISTAEAYSMVQVSSPQFDLRNLADLPVEQWKDYVVNDFEPFLFVKYPELKRIKEQLYRMGAFYASVSGSGSAVFGLFFERPDVSGLKYPFVWQSY